MMTESSRLYYLSPQEPLKKSDNIKAFFIIGGKITCVLNCGYKIWGGLDVDWFTMNINIKEMTSETRMKWFI